MFSPDNFVEQLGLNQAYRLIRWSDPPITPRVIEFLDTQDTFLSGTIYIAEEKSAKNFFMQHEVVVYPGVLLLTTDATGEPPEFPDNLTVLGFFDTLGKVYNLLSTYIDTPAVRDNSRRFSEILDEIIVNPMLSTNEIRGKLNDLSGMQGQFASIFVLVFTGSPKSDIPYTRIMKQIEALIPNCCAAVYGKEIIFLTTYDERRFDYPYEFEQITAIIEKYDGYMVISNGTRHLYALRALYLMTQRIITIARELEVATDTRIFTFERLSTYLAIDLCSRGLDAFAGSDELMYLAHPAIVAISRYDNKNNDNLRGVLYFYLFHDRSIKRTADALFMHRNTVMNKVKKINQLFNIDFEDRHLRQRLLFSCQLAKYYEGMGKILKNE